MATVGRVIQGLSPNDEVRDSHPSLLEQQELPIGHFSAAGKKTTPLKNWILRVD